MYYLLSLFTGEILVQTFVVFRSPLFAFIKNLNKRPLFMVTNGDSGPLWVLVVSRVRVRGTNLSGPACVCV